MRDTKGKRKRLLYLKRNREKLFRAQCRRKKKIKASSARGGVEDFLGTDYVRVINHLEEYHFRHNTLFERMQTEVGVIKIPVVFSISENADEVTRVLRRMYGIAMDPRIKKLNFDHTECRELGLAASTILDVILLAVKQYRSRHSMELECEGVFSTRSKEVNNILLASGLSYHLSAESWWEYDSKKVEQFEIVKGHNVPSAKMAGTTATKLTEYFNKCLKTQNYEITERGKAKFGKIFGEVLTNCEIHGGENSTWYTQGHYQMKKENTYGEMQLLFLNLGNSIYEGLKKDSSEETQQKLRYMIKAHKEHFSRDWSEEMLCTVVALQEGISRLRDEQISGYEGRGSGTVSMIEMFYDLGRCEDGLVPRMTIVSGNTQIKFTEKYKMQMMNFDQDPVFGTGEKKIIAFNEANDIYSPPDGENVTRLKEFFPGTVISLKFYLDKRFIARRKEKR
ncbi:MAG: hypothetical protein ACI39H_02950 [Lachnospiraceae bacterium]